jgi:hypothetical protein
MRTSLSWQPQRSLPSGQPQRLCQAPPKPDGMAVDGTAVDGTAVDGTVAGVAAVGAGAGSAGASHPVSRSASVHPIGDGAAPLTPMAATASCAAAG